MTEKLSKEEKERIRRAEKKKRNKTNRKTATQQTHHVRPRNTSQMDDDSYHSELLEAPIEVPDGHFREVLERFQKRESELVSLESVHPVTEQEPHITFNDQRHNLIGEEVKIEVESNLIPESKKAKMTVAELKAVSARPDLVEAIDVTAPDPHFLIWLKSLPNVVGVPVHWSSKRKYMANKRGVDRVPYRLPNFIEATGIARIRAAVIQKEQERTMKARQREKIRPKTGRMDIDFKVLHDAFFKFQTKPAHLTAFGDLYFEGREQETRWIRRPGQLSAALREALGMPEGAPPPWLINMQRFGPPPAYPDLKVPGVNAPIPYGASFGYHPGGWGQPPLDDFGNPLFGKWKPEIDRAALESGLSNQEDRHWGDMIYRDSSESEDVLDDEEDSPKQTLIHQSHKVKSAVVPAATLSARDILKPTSIPEPPTISQSQPSFEELYRVVPEKASLPTLTVGGLLPPTKGYAVPLSAEEVRKQLEAHSVAAAETAAKAHIVESAPKKAKSNKKFKF